ncbi:UDP-N-acetylmuramate--L-alanine ligase [Patescibacteria group bacterium]
MFNKYKKIHFIGIGGIGISAVAKWAHLEGIEISGSELEITPITREFAELGIDIIIGHDKENVPKDADLVVYSFAVPASNPERGLRPEKSYFEFLGELTRDYKLIAVSGTNGKSTTTAMLGKILVDAGLDPIVVVGSKINAFSHGNFNYGKGDIAVVEACEHNAHMLKLHPWSVVLTNIEADHLDFYKNLDNILKAFGEFAGKVKKDGFLVYNADDKNTIGFPKPDSIKKVVYGVHEDAEFRFEERHIDKGAQFFEVLEKNEKIGKAELQIPGEFNAYNAMAAFATARKLGVSPAKILESLKAFEGLWRRFEKVGEYDGAPVISDYGHHPHAIEGTLLAAREFYPDRRVVLAFEPHQHHRTKALFEDFVRAFDGADVLILSEIYNVSGRIEEKDRDISSHKLADAVVEYWETDENKKESKKHKLFYCENLKETEKLLREEIKKDDVVIIMGAGDIYKVAERLCGI